MNSPIESNNLSVAWAEAFLTLMQPGCSEIKPLMCFRLMASMTGMVEKIFDQAGAGRSFDPTTEPHVTRS